VSNHRSRLFVEREVTAQQEHPLQHDSLNVIVSEVVPKTESTSRNRSKMTGKVSPGGKARLRRESMEDVVPPL
jgi:hypothetical protein